MRALFDTLNESKLQGLKFLATSRLDPSLVSKVDSFQQKALYRLQDVGKRQVTGDIKTYLTMELPHFANRAEMDKLVALADGNVVTFDVNPQNHQLSSKKSTILGTQEANFKAIPRGDSAS